MSAKSTVGQLVVTPATAQANIDAGLYVLRQNQLIAAAEAVAAVQVVAGEPQGVIVLAVAAALQALVTAFPSQVEVATITAQAAFA